MSATFERDRCHACFARHQKWDRLLPARLFRLVEIAPRGTRRPSSKEIVTGIAEGFYQSGRFYRATPGTTEWAPEAMPRMRPQPCARFKSGEDNDSGKG